MNECPNCNAALSANSNKCETCGLSLTQEFAANVQKPQNGDDDRMPTKFQKIENQIHTTTSSDGSRFVAGVVLANRYRILGLLGRGGMGEVYKAEDLELNQTVALKFLPKSFSRDKSALARFRSEVRYAPASFAPELSAACSTSARRAACIIFRWYLSIIDIFFN